MGPIVGCLLIGLLGCAHGASTGGGHHNYGNHYGDDGDDYVPTCWDCNYAPSGFVKLGDWSQSAAEVGYLRCGLVSTWDPYFLHRTECPSNRCFIRKEDNGMVYRGCADEANLLWDVNPRVNCKYQGPGNTLWYFCEGDGCNTGHIGESEELCGAPPAPVAPATPAPTEEPPQDDTPVSDPGDDDVHYGYDEHLPYLSHNHAQDHGAKSYYGAHLVALSLVPWRFGRYAGGHGYGGRGYGGRGYYGPGHGRGGYPPKIDYQPTTGAPTYAMTEAAEYNPCDGDCSDNPSGLYAMPGNPNQFIQCGCANHDGIPCVCCQKHIMDCAYPKTVFDNSLKVCVRD